MRHFLLCVALAFTLAGCRDRTSLEDELETRTVTLPNGAQVRAEVKIRSKDMAQGMMFREALPRGQGMLFIHSQPGPHRYYMYNVRIPLDIVFMDSSRRILLIAASVPPCHTAASACPTYGGPGDVRYVLELGAGEAARNGLQTGDTLSF